ncbi:hypothetical protein, partial [Candidatus Nardonella dryophthoridicola]|nr:hypothetical protein [endosymbiont of Metamasius hemipterus]
LSTIPDLSGPGLNKAIKSIISLLIILISLFNLLKYFLYIIIFFFIIYLFFFNILYKPFLLNFIKISLSLYFLFLE